MPRRRVAVIGAGAAGTMAAIFAAAAGAETLLLERTRDGGRKILISGGGRCNILPARVDERRFVTDSSPHTLRKILRSWPLAEQIAFFERELGLPLVEERETAKLFPASNRARDVRDGLLALARPPRRAVPDGDHGHRARAAWRTAGGSSARARRRSRWTRWSSRPAGSRCRTPAATAAGWRCSRRWGTRCTRPTPRSRRSRREPGAVRGARRRLACRSRSPRATATRSAAASGGFLFTHRGYSGPSVLDVSHVAVRSRGEGDGAARGSRCRWTGARRGGVGVRARAGGHPDGGRRAPARAARPAGRRAGGRGRRATRRGRWRSSGERSGCG